MKKNSYANSLVLAILLLLLLFIAKKAYDFYKAKKFIQQNPNLNEQVTVIANNEAKSYNTVLNRIALKIAAEKN